MLQLSCQDRSYPLAARRGRAAALSIVELLVVIVILTVMAVILVPMLTKVRESGRSVQCTNNLRQISIALHAFALDNQNRMPDPGLEDQSWEQMLQPNYYNGKLECPADEEMFPSVGSSYDWRDTGQESTTMAGHSVADVQRLDAVFVMEALPGWHEQGLINVVRINGAAQTIPAEACFKDLLTPIRPVN